MMGENTAFRCCDAIRVVPTRVALKLLIAPRVLASSPVMSTGSLSLWFLLKQVADDLS